MPYSFCRNQRGVNTDDFLPGETNAATNSQQEQLMPALLIISDASPFLLMGFCLETAWLGGHLESNSL
ncbi:Hypothetical protein P9303_08331 [Prochlorococcus marinus str. MIT 9303]|uniref:Uncharacterized protein n=1 Tax=Prochlorococcus marinus (strain MIT 9303) TaxID=59922 RepID=A2C7X4_PROM3|nr:Hypothetical protein P9303_08331 [Prochlorococcus marinus str. MIT 9303]